MNVSSRILAAACAVAALPVLAGPAAAAPAVPNLALTNADAGVVQEVQYRRGSRGGYWRGGRWIGPAAGVAAGLAIGSALARPYNDYGAYAYAPGYAYGSGYGSGYAPSYPDQFPAARCGDEGEASAYPSWACPANPNANGW